MSCEVKRLLEQNRYDEALSSVASALPTIGLSEESIKRLRKLYETMHEVVYPLCHGPFPADHGERHVIMVLANLLDLVHRAPTLDARNIELLFAAGLVHDAAMSRLALAIDSKPDLCSLRKQHAQEVHISSCCQPHLEKLYPHEFQEVLAIASAHAGDDQQPADQKLLRFQMNRRSAHLKPLAKLLQAADFFDLGAHRLLPDKNWVPWEESQKEHLDKHRALEIDLDVERRLVLVRLRPRSPSLEEYQLYQKVRDDAGRIVTDLASSNLGEWDLHEDWEAHGALLGVEVVGTFRDKFESEWEIRAQAEPFEVDLMGHSLYGLFVEDRDGVLARLSRLPAEAQLRIRVLLLDPSHETQQMFEVAATQENRATEQGRNILPDYAKPGATNSKGDVLASIEDLRGRLKGLPRATSVDVRLTRRLMYATLNRFGSAMLVQPYASGGTTKGSALLHTRKGLNLYKTYHAEFESIWEDAQTTPLIHHTGRSATASTAAPPSPQGRSSNLEYERFVADAPIQERIARWFAGEEAPPLEVEIQTSSECQLACTHCIGAHVGHVRHWQPATTVDRFRSIFAYDANGLQVERVRISGLYGDPLFGDEATALSRALVEAAKAKQLGVVLFTNGLGLTPEIGAFLRKTLKPGDVCHVSVDAARAEQYRGVKRTGDDAFARLLRNLKALAPREFELGIGFVLTEQNAADVEAMAAWSRAEARADFARFKLDVRGPMGVSWRTWERSRKSCESLSKASGTRVYFTDSPWQSQFPGVRQRCWLQLLCPAVSGDGLVYTCDHQVGRGEPLGDLAVERFADIWRRHWERSRAWMTDPALRFPYGVARNTLCAVCPPFGAYLNRYVEAKRVGASP